MVGMDGCEEDVDGTDEHTGMISLMKVIGEGRPWLEATFSSSRGLSLACLTSSMSSPSPTSNINTGKWVTVAALAGLAVAAVGYVVYFDYKRRNDATFRRTCRRRRMKPRQK